MANDVILIGSDGLGLPEQQLAGLLMGNFLRLLGDRDELPQHIVLWNGGVRLAAADSDKLDHLKKLEERGVEVILCRTCVEYFGVEDKISVGNIDTMVRILEILSRHHVLTI